MSAFDFESLRAEAEAIIVRYERKAAAILPLLSLVQERFGYITDEAEQWVGRLVDIAPVHIHEVVTFYTLFRRQPKGTYRVQVCRNLVCALNGAEQRLEQIARRLGIQPGEMTADGRFSLETVECLCACEVGPVMQVNDTYVAINDETIASLTEAPEALPEIELRYKGVVGLSEPVLSERMAGDPAPGIESYLESGGYKAALKALKTMEPDAIIKTVTDSNLRGLGGAGFPTGRKWSFIPKDTDKPKFLVVNADEGEPGTLKDRYLIMCDPHRLIEGMLIAAYATGCRKAYIYIRGEYVAPADCLQAAVDEAYRHGYLGKAVAGTDFSLDIVVHRGAGAYICGEESALLNSLEGKKGFPRLKPPFPAISGLFEAPTVINNVETLCSVPAIIERGAEWFKALGCENVGGTRLFSISGHIETPGVYEASHAVTLKQLLEAAGGVRDGKRLKAVIPGGISAKILRADEIDVAMDFDSLLKAGTMAGSAAIIVMDEDTCMVRALWYASKFFAHESCGQCSPCREGTGWIFKVVDRIVQGNGRPQDLDLLLGVSRSMEGRTICVFADAAAWPVQSYIMKFRDEFEYYIEHKRSKYAGSAETHPVAALL